MIDHPANPPATAKELAQAQAQFGAAAQELLAIHALHDGAELFRHDDECRFLVAAIDQWGELLQRAIQSAEKVTWQDDKDEIPPYLYSAIAFGMIPGDHARWLLITEGEHAGKIMHSDSDLMDESPRFDSMAQFMSALLQDPARVLNCGGHARYVVDGRERFAVRYREQ